MQEGKQGRIGTPQQSIFRITQVEINGAIIPRGTEDRDIKSLAGDRIGEREGSGGGGVVGARDCRAISRIVVNADISPSPNRRRAVYLNRDRSLGCIRINTVSGIAE